MHMLKLIDGPVGASTALAVSLVLLIAVVILA
jgi:hypothetical protein